MNSVRANWFSMTRHREYWGLMESIRHAHQAFAKCWAEAKATALTSIASRGDPTYPQHWQANSDAYRAAQPLAEKRNALLGKLFQEHLGPLRQEFAQGNPDAVHAIIDFLEVDVPAFHCGYAKEEWLRMLKTVPLNDEHRERLRQYGLQLCSMPEHRREITQAGRLMILVADRELVDQLRELALNDNDRVAKKATKMLGVVRNGRPDLR